MQIKASSTMMAEPSETIHTDHPTRQKGRVLVADYQDDVRQSYTTLLEHAGYTVDTACTAQDVIHLLKHMSFNALISDTTMPGMQSAHLLQAIRQLDHEIAVILTTDGPAVESAISAIEYGVMRYLIKPLQEQELLKVVGQAVLVNQIGRARREALSIVKDAHLENDKALAETQFRQALQTVWIAFQPIVLWPQKHIFGYEALMRTRDPLFPNPGVLLDAAEHLDSILYLGRTIRRSVADRIKDAPKDAMIFVNLHTLDLLDADLYNDTSPLMPYAQQIILEITERRALDAVDDLSARIAKLRSMGYQIAIDDLGAGYAGLNMFTQLEPEVVKLDMTLIRNIHAQPTKRTLVKSIVSLCNELKIRLIAEGIETEQERDVAAALGITLMQGYLFAKPDYHFEQIIR